MQLASADVSMTTEDAIRFAFQATAVTLSVVVCRGIGSTSTVAHVEVCTVLLACI